MTRYRGSSQTSHTFEWGRHDVFLFTQSDSLILLQMLSKYGKDSSVTQMVDKLDWVIMPVFNVDGYVFTQTVIQLKSHSYQTLNMFKRC